MATVVKIVSVRTGREVSRATVADDGQVAYDGGESARGAVKQAMRELGAGEAEAVLAVARDGWSNGYLMVELPEGSAGLQGGDGGGDR